MLELNTHTFRRGTNSHETRHQRKTQTQKLHYVEVTAFSNATILRKDSKKTTKEREGADPSQIPSSSLDAAYETRHTMFIFHLSDV